MGYIIRKINGGKVVYISFSFYITDLLLFIVKLQ